MSQPIYVSFKMKAKEPWYQLSEDEKNAMMARMNASMEAVGAESIVMCDCSWSSEPWQYFGVVKFPSLEALQKHRQDANGFDWPRYVDGHSIVGTEWQP